MAIQSIVEPYVKVQERIRDYPTQLSIDGSINIGGVIVAPTGPRLAYIKGNDEFLATYTLDGKVPRNADITFLNAYYLSFSTGLVLVRAMNTTAVGGLYFVKKAVHAVKAPIQISDETLWGLELNGKYYWHNITANQANFIQQLTELITTETSTSITLESSENSEGSEYSWINELIENLTEDPDYGVYVKDLNDLADKLATETCRVSYTENSGVLTFVSNSKITPLQSDCELNIAYVPGKDEESSSLEGHSMTWKDGNALSLTADMTLTPSGNNWVLKFGTMAYYCGAIDKSKYEEYSLIQVKSIAEIASNISRLSGMNATYLTEPSNTIRMTCSEGNEISSALVSGDGIEVAMGEWTDNSDYDSNIFVCYASVPQNSNVYNIKLEESTTSGLIELTLYDGKQYKQFTVSFDPDAVDETGVNCYIENLNAMRLGFTFVVNSNLDIEEVPDQIPATVYPFGNSGLNIEASKSTASRIDALSNLANQDKYDVEAIAPLGYTDLQFVKSYAKLGLDNDWFSPVDIPYNRTNQNSIRSYFLNVADSSNIIAFGPFDKKTSLTGWMTYIAASSIYYTKIMSNKAADKEAAPVFDITNGVLDYSDPCYLLGPEDRLALLNAKCPINFLIYDENSDVYYFNDNRTHQSVNNIVSEEQNRRTVNKVKKGCKKLLRGFKGRLNTSSTREDVNNTLKAYFRQTYIGKQYGILSMDDVQIQCDDNNNTKEITDANKLAVIVRIRLNGSIKFVDVLVDVFPLGVDFEA